MTKQQIIRAWKDETYRTSLTAQQLAELPYNPAGTVELEAHELGSVAGGEGTEPLGSYGCCKWGMISRVLSCEACPLPPTTETYVCK